MKRTYEIEYDWSGASMKVEIDHAVMTDEELHKINEFWSCHEDRLDDAEGNILHAVLKLLFAEILYIQMEGGFNTQGVVSAFDWDGKGLGRNGVEGWPKMDGSAGIKIIDVCGFEFDPSDMTISEVSSGQ